MATQESAEKIRGGVQQAIAMLTDNPRDHKQGIRVLVTLTKKKEYLETSASMWIECKGAAKTLSFLNECPLEEPKFHPLLGKHLKLLVNVTREEKFITPLVDGGLVEALIRVLDCPSDAIRSSTLKLIGLICVDESARRQILEGNLISEMMNVVTGKDETFLVSVLPRLLRDEKLALCFCQHGGIAFLQKTMTMALSPQGVTGAIVATSLIAQFPKLVVLLVEEEEFVSSLIMMLTYNGEGIDLGKLKVLLLKTIYAVSGNPEGLKLVQESGPLPFMELIEHAESEQLAAVVAAFEVLNVLCGDKEMCQEVDRMGASEFVETLLFFITSTNMNVLEPLCRLLRALAQGDNRIQIIEGIKAERAKRPDVELFGATLDAISGGRSLTVAESVSASVEGELVRTRMPTRRMTEKSQTVRQGAKRIAVIKEILSTERTYLATMEKLVKCFMQPMQENANARSSVIASKEVTAIYGNLMQIVELHRTFLKRLEGMVKVNPSCTLSGWFSELADKLVDTYKPYFQHYRESQDVLEKKMHSKAFSKFLVKLQKEAKEGLQLDSMLIMPIQRLPRYVLLLKELDKATVDNHPEKVIIASTTKKFAGKVEMLDDVTTLPASAAEQGAPQGRFASMRLSTSPAARSSTMSSQLEQPALREGILREYLDDQGSPVLRRALLMRDKLVIMATSRSSRTTTNASSTLVHSFPLSALRLDMLQDSFELVDLRDNLSSGPEFDCEDAGVMRDWVNAILDAIFDAKYDRN